MVQASGSRSRCSPNEPCTHSHFNRSIGCNLTAAFTDILPLTTLTPSLPPAPMPPLLLTLSLLAASKVKCWSPLISTHEVESKRNKVCLSSLSTVGNPGGLTWARHSSCKSSATHSHQCAPFPSVCTIPISVHSIFMCVNNMYGCQCLGFLTCAQMLMQADADVVHRVLRTL